MNPADWQIPSPGRFAWMFAPKEIVRQPDKAIPSREEFAEACEFALASWQVLPIVAPNLFRWGRSRNCRTKVAKQVQDRLTSILAFSRVCQQISRRLLRNLEGRQVPYAAIKGSAMQMAVYASSQLRIGKDIDIAVPWRALRRAEAAARETGFIPAQWDEERKRFYLADPVCRAAVEREHYELGFLARHQIVHGLSNKEQAAIRREIPNHYLWHETDSGDLACYCCVDIHHGLSLDIRCEHAVRSRRRVNFEGLSLWVPAHEWLMLHVIYKIYWEGVYNYNKGGYQFADLAALVCQADGDTFMRLIELLEKYALEAAGFYVLRRLQTDLHMSLPPEIEAYLGLTAQVSARTETMPMNDMGDMWPKLWGRR